MKVKIMCPVPSGSSNNLKFKTFGDRAWGIRKPIWLRLAAIIVVLVMDGGMAEAQQAKKVPKIGFLMTNSGSINEARLAAFKQGLLDLQYVEGQNVTIEYRSAEGKADQLPALAEDLVRLKVDVIVTAGSVPTKTAKDATKSIPIVMGNDNDPVASGHVASLARPGGNITGMSSVAPELSGKRLELLKEIVPRLSRVAIFGTSNTPQYGPVIKESELAAAVLGVKLQYLDVLAPKDLETAFREASKGRADAVLLLPSPVLNAQRTQTADLAVKNRLPVIGSREYVEAGGGLMSYGVSVTDLFRRAATFVDKILKGAKPSDLPVEQPMKFELFINLKAAKQIGITIPPNVLVRADRVIK